MHAKRVRQGGIEFIAIADKRYKSCTLGITFCLPHSHTAAARNAIFAPILIRGSRKYPTMSALAQRCEDLYGLSLRARTSKVGKQQMASLNFTFPGPGFMRHGIRDLRSVLTFAADLLFEPLVEEKGFHQAIFEAERAQLLRSIDSLSDNKQRYAFRRAMEFSFPQTPYGMPEYGSRDQVTKLKAQTAYQHFQRLRAHAKIVVSLTGPVQPEKHLPEVERAFNALPARKAPRLPRNRPAKYDGAPRRKTEHEHLEQAYVVQTFVSGTNLAHKRAATLSFADAIFGRISTSRLFRVVREEHGLAYATSSNLDLTTGIGLAFAACDPARLADAAKLMKRQLAELQAGGCTDEEFEAARSTLIDEELSSLDMPGAHRRNFLISESCGVEYEPEAFLNELRKVTQKKVKSAFARYKPVLDYRLVPK